MNLFLLGAFFALFSDVYGTPSNVRKTPYNITGKWFLPNFNSPVFYLHFRDRISWIEADAVCQFHHSQLVTIDTPIQFEDVKSYLRQLYYEEAIWIGLRRSSPQEPFKWTDDSVASTDEYWKEKPLKDEKLCVISSPADDYHWIGRQCNGPDVASFICEMPIPKWVKNSPCMLSLDGEMTMTFHPEKSMIKAGKFCNNTDVKYIECHDPGKENKYTESVALIKEHLKCPEDAPLKQQSSPSTNTVKLRTTLIAKASTSTPPTTSTSTSAHPRPQTSPSVLTTSNANSPNVNEFNNSADPEFYNKNIVILETISESSTISLPQEMSFAEEPIKASKAFIKEPTEQPEHNTPNANTTPQHKSNPNNLNLIPTSTPGKKCIRINNTVFEQPKARIFSLVSFFSTASTLSNTTVEEESHEAFNNDKDREAFQDPSIVKEPVKMEFGAKNLASRLRNFASKSSESEEAAAADRTYNIEGTFDSNDFVNAEPINVYKKIDLTPVETTVGISYASSTSRANNLISKLIVMSTEATTSPSLATEVTKIEATSTLSTVSTNSFNQTKATKSAKEEAARRQRISSLLGGRDNEDERNFPNRKRQIVNTERHSFYPYFLGRILG